MYVCVEGVGRGRYFTYVAELVRCSRPVRSEGVLGYNKYEFV